RRLAAAARPEVAPPRSVADLRTAPEAETARVRPRRRADWALRVGVGAAPLAGRQTARGFAAAVAALAPVGAALAVAGAGRPEDAAERAAARPAVAGETATIGRSGAARAVGEAVLAARERAVAAGRLAPAAAAVAPRAARRPGRRARAELQAVAVFAASGAAVFRRPTHGSVRPAIEPRAALEDAGFLVSAVVARVAREPGAPGRRVVGRPRGARLARLAAREVDVFAACAPRAARTAKERTEANEANEANEKPAPSHEATPRTGGRCARIGLRFTPMGSVDLHRETGAEDHHDGRRVEEGLAVERVALVSQERRPRRA